MDKTPLKIISFFSIGLVGYLAFSIPAGLWFKSSGEAWLKAKVQEKLQGDVFLESVKTNYFNSFSIQKFQVDGPIKIGIEEAHFSFRPWGVFLYPVGQGHLVQVQVRGLDVSGKLSSGNSQKKSSSETSAAFVPKIRFPILVVAPDAKVDLTKGTKQLFLDSFTTSLVFGFDSLIANLTSSAEGWGNLSLDLNLNSLNKPKFDFVGSASAFDMSKASLLFAKVKAVENISGPSQVKAMARGSWPPENISEFDWEVELKSKKLKWKRGKNQKPYQFETDMVVSPQSASGKVVVDKKMKVVGDVSSPFSGPQLDVNLNINQMQLSRVLTLLRGKSQIMINGPLKANVDLNGPLKKPILEGKFSFVGDRGLLKIPKIEGQVQLLKNEVTLEANGSGGKIRLWRPPGQVSAFNVSINEISLDKIAKANGWENVKGKIQSRFSFDPNKKPMGLNGNFQIDDFRWGRQAKREAIRGRMAYKKYGFFVTTNENDLTLAADFRGSVINLNQFRIRLGQESEVSSQGEFNVADKSYALSFSGQQIPPDIWPPLTDRYPEIAGALNLEGSVKKKRDDFNGKVQVVFNQLQFIPTGGQWNGTTQVFWDKNNVSFKKIQVDGGYSGEVSRQKLKNKVWWNANLSLEESDPQLVADIFRSSAAVRGEMSGAVDLKFDGKELIGTSSVTWLSGSVGDFQFDQFQMASNMESKSVSLDDFRLIRGGKAIRGKGVFKRRKNDWAYNLNAQSQQWGIKSLSFDGELRAEGIINPKKKLIRGKLGAPVFWVNDYSLEGLKVRFDNNKNRWRVNGEAGDQLDFNFVFNPQSSGLKGQFNAKSLKLEDVFEKMAKTFLTKDKPKGVANAKVKVRGTIQNPRWQMNLVIPEAEWREEKFKSKLFLGLQGSTLSVISSKTEMQNGGTIFTRGILNLSKDGSIDMSGVGSGLKLDTVFKLLRWPIRWEGKTDATFSVKGKKAEREIKVVFDGSHEGLGPFSQGGPISGTAVSEKGEWNLEGIRVGSGNGYAQLAKGSRIFIDKTKAGKMRLVADARNIAAGVLTLFGQVELTGSWFGHNESGATGSPSKEIDIFARSLWINQFLLNGNVTHLTISKGRLEFSPIIGSGQQLSGTLDYSDYPKINVQELTFLEDGEEKLYLDGDIGAPHWDYSVRVKDIDAGVVRGLLDTRWPISGPMDIRAKGKGNLKEPQVSGDLTWRGGYWGPVPLDLATSRVSLDDGIVTLRKIFAKKKKGYVVKGRVKVGTNLTERGLRQKPEIHLKVDKGDFALLKEIWPDVYKSKGSFKGLVAIGKNIRGKRKISGYLKAQDIKIRSSAHIPNLKKGRLHLKIDGDRLNILEGRAKLSKGVVNLKGHVQFSEGEIEKYNLSMFTSSRRGISVRVPELAIPPGPVLGRFSILKKKLAGISRGEPFVDVSLTGPATQPLLKGKIVLEKTIFTYPPPEKDKKAGRINMAQRWLRDFYNRLRWDLVLETGKKTRYENTLLGARVQGKIHLTGTTQDMVVNGRIQTLDGSLVYSGNEFKINEAVLEVLTEKPKLELNQEAETLLYLKANAEKEVFYTDGLGETNQATIIMEVDRALLGEIQPRFRSKDNPNLNSEKALRLALGLPISESFEQNELLAGQTQTSNQKEFDRMLRTSLVQLLDSSLASPLARAIARQTGLVDFIRVTYQEDESSLESNNNDINSEAQVAGDVTENQWVKYMKGTKVKMGRGLSNRLFADYSFRVDEFENELDLRHEVELAYRVHRNFFLRAIGELDSERTLGRPPDRRALLENQWRFGLPRRSKEKKKESDEEAENNPKTLPNKS